MTDGTTRGRDGVAFRLPPEQDGDLLATVTGTGSHQPDGRDRAPAAAIGARHTERAPFLPRAVRVSWSTGCRSRPGTCACGCRPITESEEVATASLVSRAEEIELREPEYLAELQRWMRSDPAAVDGIPVGAVPADDPSTRPPNWLVRDLVVGSRPAASPSTQALDRPATRTRLRSRPSPVGHPEILLRLGHPSGDRSPSTSRRPVADVLTSRRAPLG
jgi:hypothetical protein